MIVVNAPSEKEVENLQEIGARMADFCESEVFTNVCVIIKDHTPHRFHSLHINCNWNCSLSYILRCSSLWPEEYNGLHFDMLIGWISVSFGLQRT